MKAKEFIPASKPRNLVAKNAPTSGAGKHKDSSKKKDQEQGKVKHKKDLMPMEAGWKDEAEDVGEWTDYVKERLTKASPEQRLSLAKKLSQVEVKNFGSSLGGGFDRNTGKAKTGELTDTVRSALRSISAGRSSDGDGPAGNFSMPFGSVDIPGMENATPEELAVMKKAVIMGPEVAGAAAKLYKKKGTITSQDLKDIETGFEKASGIEWGKPTYSSPEAKASRERAMAGEGIAEGSTDITPNWAKYVLDQIYNSNGSVTMTDLFDEGIPGLHDMFMATAEAHGLDPEEEFEEVQEEVLDQLEKFVKGEHQEGVAERVRDPEDWDEGNTEPGNNFAVYINGKKWKVLPGPAGAYADSPEERREFERLKAMAQRKSQESGKKWEVYVTGEQATR